MVINEVVFSSFFFCHFVANVSVEGFQVGHFLGMRKPETRMPVARDRLSKEV